MRQIIEKTEKINKTFPDRAIVVNGHCNNFFKKVMLIELLELLKNKFKDCCIIYATHLPVDLEIYDYVDYVVYNKNNPIFNKEINTDFSKSSWWWNTWTYRGDKNLRLMRNQLYHGYAHHMLLNDSTALAKNQRIEFIHYVNYDVRLDVVETLNVHYKLLKSDGYDLVAYQYFDDGMGTEFFSARTNAAVDSMCSVLSLEEYESFRSPSLEQQYKIMFKGKKIKNLGFFKQDDFDVGRLKFDFRDKVDTVVLLNSNIDGVIIIPYMYEGVSKINISNSNSYSQNIKIEQYDSTFEKKHFEFVPLSSNQWIELIPRPDSRYVKIFFDDIEKTFFDLSNKFNYGICMTF